METQATYCGISIEGRATYTPPYWDGRASYGEPGEWDIEVSYVTVEDWDTLQASGILAYCGIGDGIASMLARYGERTGRTLPSLARILRENFGETFREALRESVS